MYKIYFSLLFVLFATSSFAQNNTFLGQELGSGNSSISIAVSGTDEKDGEDFFSEADRNEKKGELYDALTLFGKAAFEFNSSRKFSKYGQALLRMGNIHMLLAHYVEAEQVVLNVALKNYSRIGSLSGQIASYKQLGRIYLADNKLTQSLWFYTQQGILAKQSGNNDSYIESILGIAQVKIKKKEYVLANKDLNRAELLAKGKKTSQFAAQIRDARSMIAEKQNIKGK
ncbi:MAG: hypothetical protein EOO85_10755 [Pedobacter sp.]|nr:MAG: hypothetical protein EOO85_10755 [Pedobacter sp.]